MPFACTHGWPGVRFEADCPECCFEADASWTEVFRHGMRSAHSVGLSLTPGHQFVLRAIAINADELHALATLKGWVLSLAPAATTPGKDSSR